MLPAPGSDILPFDAALLAPGPGKVVRSGEVWAGAPARKLRMVTDAERANFRQSAEHYFDLAQQHVKDLMSLQSAQ